MASVTFQDPGSQLADDSALRQSLLLGVALLFSFMLHAMAVLFFPDQPNEGAADYGYGGTVVSLGAAGREVGGEVAKASGDAPQATEVIATDAEQLEVFEAVEEVAVESVTDARVTETTSVAEANTASEVQALEATEPPTDAVAPSDVVSLAATEAAIQITPDPAVLSEPLAARVRETETIEQVEAQEVAEAVEAQRAAPPLPKRRPVRQVVRPKAQENPQPLVPTKRAEAPKTPSAKKSAAHALSPEKLSEGALDGDSERQSQQELAGEGGKSGRSGLSEVGDGDNTPGGGAPGTQSDYYRLVLAWLEKHKRYPRRSKLRNEQGVVMLRFIVSRDGSVSTSRITQSSGHKRLDKEAMSMIKRAQPLPAMPADMREASLNLVIPVKFELH